MENQQFESNGCPSFKDCKAPICPKDKSFFLAIWYPSEPICTSLIFRKETWRNNQRKILKVNNIHSIEGFFTFSRLYKIRAVTKHIKGLTEHQDFLLHS